MQARAQRAALERPDYTDAAVACAEFVWRDMRDGDGPVLYTVNGVEVSVWPWARWREAETAYAPSAGSSLSTGRGILQDECGEPIDPDGHVVPESRIRFREAAKGGAR